MSNPSAEGVLKLNGKKGGELRAFTRSFRPSESDVRVPKKLIERYALPQGALVTGPVKMNRGKRELAAVESVCGLAPEEFAKRRALKTLTAIQPDSRFELEKSGEEAMRYVDLVAPIAKGTRGLIVAPPKAGKTTLMTQIAEGIRASSPETRVVILLIDERPEEVTEFRRNVDAEVLFSSSDQTVAEHVELAELTLGNLQCELECGRDVVLLVDSLTRMGRSFNLSGNGRGRTLSGGMEAGALEIPRRFFGLARNIEDGGSVTIIATALVDTGSKMDQLIFEEFKGTGNSEIILDRGMAEARIFPAINLPESGTRREELLYQGDDAKRITKLRRLLGDRKPREAMAALQKLLLKHSCNTDFLQTIPV